MHGGQEEEHMVGWTETKPVSSSSGCFVFCISQHHIHFPTWYLVFLLSLHFVHHYITFLFCILAVNISHTLSYFTNTNTLFHMSCNKYKPSYVTLRYSLKYKLFWISLQYIHSFILLHISSFTGAYAVSVFSRGGIFHQIWHTLDFLV